MPKKIIFLFVLLFALVATDSDVAALTCGAHQWSYVIRPYTAGSHPGDWVVEVQCIQAGRVTSSKTYGPVLNTTTMDYFQCNEEYGFAVFMFNIPKLGGGSWGQGLGVACADKASITMLQTPSITAPVSNVSISGNTVSWRLAGAARSRVIDWCAVSNQPPVANANGPYTAAKTPSAPVSFNLSGAGSTDAEDCPSGGAACSKLSYSWSVIGANTAECSFPTHTGIGVSPPILCNKAGTSRVKLTVTDFGGLPNTNTAEADISISAANTPPTANANGPYIKSYPFPVTFNLSGAGSTDAEDCPSGGAACAKLNYSWSVTGGVNDAECSLLTGSGVFPQIQCNKSGASRVKLTVTDSGGLTSDAYADIKIANTPPIADANGPYIKTKTTPGPVSITLDGSGSRDPDSTEGLRYNWILLENYAGCELPPSYSPFDQTLTINCQANGRTNVKLQVADSQLLSNDPAKDPNDETYIELVAPATLSAKLYAAFDSLNWQDNVLAFPYWAVGMPIVPRNIDFKTELSGTASGPYNYTLEFKPYGIVVTNTWFNKESASPTWTLTDAITYMSNNAFWALAEVTVTANSGGAVITATDTVLINAHYFGVGLRGKLDHPNPDSSWTNPVEGPGPFNGVVDFLPDCNDLFLETRPSVLRYYCFENDPAPVHVGTTWKAVKNPSCNYPLGPPGTVYWAKVEVDSLIFGSTLSSSGLLKIIPQAAPPAYIDSGLRVYNKGKVIPIAAYADATQSALKIYRSGKIYNIVLLNSTDFGKPEDSGVRICTKPGVVKALRVYP